MTDGLISGSAPSRISLETAKFEILENEGGEETIGEYATAGDGELS